MAPSSLVTGERTRAGGIFYLQRKPHPEAWGERPFVMLTCEPLLLKRNLVPGEAQLRERCSFMLNSCVCPANHENVSLPEPLKIPGVLFSLQRSSASLIHAL